MVFELAGNNFVFVMFEAFQQLVQEIFLVRLITLLVFSTKPKIKESKALKE